MTSIIFRINLKPINSGLLTDTEASQFANTMDVFIPGLLGGENITKNHGETFTLTGQKAYYLKNLIENNHITHIELYTEPVETEVNSLPDVEYLDLYSLGLDTFAHWQFNNENMTDIQIKINDEEWVSLDVFDIGIGESII